MKAETDFDALVGRLATRAATLATAWAASRRRAARQDDRRWRHAGLIWPLFAKG
ncbi:hypothetical protein [Novosphingobium guangzhouense]|uniref:hypothetical protein n=1 Tax=Novosphingobium guangzhouense TaxID=1850347 RepID=UPI00147621F3|nr:hypothetical protein [Novosphingobium guangzhouense]